MTDEYNKQTEKCNEESNKLWADEYNKKWKM